MAEEKGPYGRPLLPHEKAPPSAIGAKGVPEPWTRESAESLAERLDRMPEFYSTDGSHWLKCDTPSRLAGNAAALIRAMLAAAPAPASELSEQRLETFQRLDILESNAKGTGDWESAFEFACQHANTLAAKLDAAPAPAEPPNILGDDFDAYDGHPAPAEPVKYLGTRRSPSGGIDHQTTHVDKSVLIQKGYHESEITAEPVQEAAGEVVAGGTEFHPNVIVQWNTRVPTGTKLYAAPRVEAQTSALTKKVLAPLELLRNWHESGAKTGYTPSQRRLHKKYAAVIESAIRAISAPRVEAVQGGCHDEDARRLNELQALFKACPHAVLTWNDDPDEDAPVGYSISIDGCDPLEVVADDMRGLIDKLRPHMKSGSAT